MLSFNTSPQTVARLKPLLPTQPATENREVTLDGILNLNPLQIKVFNRWLISMKSIYR